MKYLSNYIDDATTNLLNDTGAFFAFSNKQFDEQKKEGTKYTSCGMGLICPTDKVDEYIKRQGDIINAGIAQDLAENGKDGVIVRELANHEAYYTGSIESTCDALEGYKDITKADILEVYRREAPKNNE